MVNTITPENCETPIFKKQYLKDQLKRCPFCGGVAELIIETGRFNKLWYVRCMKCSARIGGTENVVRKWNARHNDNEEKKEPANA